MGKSNRHQSPAEHEARNRAMARDYRNGHSPRALKKKYGLEIDEIEAIIAAKYPKIAIREEAA